MQMQKFISDGVPQKMSRERSGEQLRSLHAAFRFETSSQSAASSFCAKAIRNPHLTRWPEVAAPGSGAEKHPQKVATDHAAVGRTKVKIKGSCDPRNASTPAGSNRPRSP